MFDINYYMKVHSLKESILKKEIKDDDYVWNKLKEFRSEYPQVYNVETTNACNMRCEMCPRTTMMTRSIETMRMNNFTKIINQIETFPDDLWIKWEKFVEEKYGIYKTGMSENHFFLYIIPKVLVLHGYGDPLMDKYMPDRVKYLTMKNIPSYFSCNPANIDIEKSLKLFENGLDYIKYSIESVDDTDHRMIRGSASNFSQSYEKILKLLKLKVRYQYKTTIVITMIDLNRDSQLEEFQKLKEAFKGLDIYIYLKSQDQKWYQGEKRETKSIHWKEFCQFPWSSMTIKSNGEAAMCVEDYNNEIVLGDTSKESLYNIWNGVKYKKLMKDHFNLRQGIKCTEKCDMNLVGNLLTERKGRGN
jgi:radical SAM family protein/iron-sulfur cluster protein